MSNNAYQPLTVKDKTILNKLGGRLIAATVFAVIVGRLSFLRAGPFGILGSVVAIGCFMVLVYFLTRRDIAAENRKTAEIKPEAGGK